MKTKYLFNKKNITDLIGKINKHNYFLLFLDYDGTLAPFHPVPARAEPFPGIKDTIRKLNRKENIIIIIISGRDIDDLTNMLNISGLNYAGNHGLKIKFSSGESFNWLTEKSDFDIRKYNKLKKKFKSRAAGGNISIEDKGSGFCLHLPQEKNEDLEEHLEKEFWNTPFEILPGRKIIEVRPAGWNKGKAVKYIIDNAQKYNNNAQKYNNIEDYFPLYIGDDSTDEDAFRVLKNETGIYVQNKGDLKTAADYYLNNPEDVYKLLVILKDRLC